jgi:hypothetical protein
MGARRRLRVRPNPSLERTSSGLPRKPAVLQLVYPRTSGLRSTPAGSAQLERYASEKQARITTAH